MPHETSLVAKCPAADALPELEALTRLALSAERLGHHWLWLDDAQGGASDIVAARLLLETRHLRIGLGDGLLRQHGAAKLAAVLRLLSALAPGRVDLAVTAADHAETVLIDLARLLSPASQPALPHGATTRANVAAPQVFLRGDTPEAAALAARLGWDFGPDLPGQGEPAFLGEPAIALRREAVSAKGRVAA